MSSRFFIDRRSGADRRKGQEQRQNPRLDLPHRRRRRQDERRDLARTKTDDFYAAKRLASGGSLSAANLTTEDLSTEDLSTDKASSSTKH